MAPSFHAPLIPGYVYQVRGLGKFPLTENPTPKDVAFPRGPRISGKQGTIDVWFVTPTAGTARDIVLLTTTNVPAGAAQRISIRIDTSNRPIARITDHLGTIVAQNAPSGSAIAAGRLLHVRLAWNSAAVIVASTGRYASLTIDGEAIPVADWTSGTNPVAAWTHYQPTHLWCGHGLIASDFVISGVQGDISAVQVSDTVTL